MPENSLHLAHNRLKEAIDAGADALVSACPFCKKNFMDAAEKFEIPLVIYNIEDILIHYLEEIKDE